MTAAFQPPPLSDALDTIEAQVLPSIADILDGLIEMSSMARARVSEQAQGAQLRRVVHELEHVTRQMEALSAGRLPRQASAEPARISA